MSQGKAIIFTAPSGAGKTTIVKYLLGQFSELVFSISATTREKREMEVAVKIITFLASRSFSKRSILMHL